MTDLHAPPPHPSADAERDLETTDPSALDAVSGGADERAAWEAYFVEVWSSDAL